MKPRKTTRAGSSSVILAAIAAVSLILKLVLVWLVADMPCSHDQCEYLNLADGIRSGQGLQLYDGFLWPPGFIFVLAGCLTLFGDTLTAPRVLQVLLSTATVPLVYTLGRRFADRRAGLAAAAVFAFYPNLVAFTHLLWPETLYIFLFLAGFLFLARSGTPATRDLVLAGVCLGAAALVRGLAFFFVPLAAAWMVWQSRRRVVPALILVGATLVPILPWTARNWVRYDRFLWIDSTIGRNLYIGTNLSPPSNWDLGFNDRRRISNGRPRCEQENPVDNDRCEVRNALAFAASHPALMIARVPLKIADLLNPSSFFLRHARLGHYPYTFTTGQLRLLTVLVAGSYMAVALLGLLGLALRPGAPGRGLILLLLVYHLGIHAFIFGMSRFRLPLVPFLMVAAGPLLTRSWRPLLAEASRWRLATAAAALLAMAGLWAWRLPTVLDIFGL